MAYLQFLGAAGTVTGSKHLINTARESGRGMQVLLDCGMFQGHKEWRERNWQPLPIPAGSIDAVILTHAHIDHSGWLPRLVKEGFRGHIYCTSATRDLCGVLLPDSGHLQEEDAAFANKHRTSKHSPALPLYTMEEAEAALRQLHPIAGRAHPWFGNGGAEAQAQWLYPDGAVHRGHRARADRRPHAGEGGFRAAGYR
jgi:metallo-beta-lactamase family protein